MKYNFPFLGIKKPQRTSLQKDFIRQAKKDMTADWNFIFELWDMPEREFHYLAQDLLIALSAGLTEKDLANVEKLIVSKSWWDTVDILSSNVAGKICMNYPELKKSFMDRWSKSSNMWLSRASILFQLKYRDKTDTALLEKIILENNGSGEFFINKAIGWALREYSKTNPAWVRDFLHNHELNSLSEREASKYI